MTTHAQAEQQVPVTRITMPIAVVASVLLVALSGAAAYYGALSAKAQQISDTKADLTKTINDTATNLTGQINAVSTDKDSKIGAVAIQVAAQKAEQDQFEKRMDRFENKMDAVILRLGGDPERAAAIGRF